jgi:hypothetical protein
VHATERRGCVEAAATEAAPDWPSPDAPSDDLATAAKTTTTEASSSAVIATPLRLSNQSRARKKRDPIEFSFHDFDFLCLFMWLFLKFTVSLA